MIGSLIFHQFPNFHFAVSNNDKSFTPLVLSAHQVSWNPTVVFSPQFLVRNWNMSQPVSKQHKSTCKERQCDAQKEKWKHTFYDKAFLAGDDSIIKVFLAFVVIIVFLIIVVNWSSDQTSKKQICRSRFAEQRLTDLAKWWWAGGGQVFMTSL